MRTIEERLTEIMRSLGGDTIRSFAGPQALLEKLLEDFRAEGIAGRVVTERRTE